MKKILGFTLLELSIVLIVIGLIMGGVLAAKEMIVSAGIRSVISQVTEYSGAVSTFRIKYDFIPGDFSLASNYIPGAVNGNGDGCIGNCAAFGTSGPPSNEYMNFWAMLTSLNLIKGSYPYYTACPSSSDACNKAYPGTNFPLLNYTDSFTRGSYLLSNFGSTTQPGLMAYGASDGNNYFHLGTGGTFSNLGGNFAPTALDVLSPQHAADIDSKIDDGLPMTGFVTAVDSSPSMDKGIDRSPSFTGSNAIITSNTTGCVVGVGSSSNANQYNPAAASTFGQCELKIRLVQ